MTQVPTSGLNPTSRFLEETIGSHDLVSAGQEWGNDAYQLLGVWGGPYSVAVHGLSCMRAVAHGQGGGGGPVYITDT